MEAIIDVGEIVIRSDLECIWRIPNFYDLSQEYNTVIRSPLFSCNARDWYMEVYPDGRRLYSSSGWFGISVVNLNIDFNLNAVILGIKGTAKEGKFIISGEESNGDGFYCCTRFLPRLLLKSLKQLFAQGGDLCLFFSPTHLDINEDRLFMNFVTEDVEKWYKQKLENKDTFIESSTQTDEEIRLKKLVEDFREILLNGNISDITLKVKGQEFKAHKSILAARSPVFLAMLMHDTKEKISGIVDIPDVDPDIFHNFLNYLYSGSVENLTSENAAELYTTADKYQVNELKESCKDLMLTNISIDNFCDVFTLSLLHNEKELQEAGIHFFAEHSLDIVLMCKWQTFLSENPITGNELFIKHLKHNK